MFSQIIHCANKFTNNISHHPISTFLRVGKVKKEKIDIYEQPFLTCNHFINTFWGQFVDVSFPQWTYMPKSITY